jgi:hypothetical protein
MHGGGAESAMAGIPDDCPAPLRNPRPGSGPTSRLDTSPQRTLASAKSPDPVVGDSAEGAATAGQEVSLQAAAELIAMRLAVTASPTQTPTKATKATEATEATEQAAEHTLHSATTRYVPPITTMLQRNTARLLPARYSDSVLTRLTDDPEDLETLFALDNATNDRLIAEANGRLGITARELVAGIPYARIINAAFAHPHPQGARFSTPYRGAWYAGFELATAKAEVLFHRSIQLSEIRWQSREDLDYDHYQADFAGNFHDLRPGAAIPYSAQATDLPLKRNQPLLSSHSATNRQDSARVACLDPDSYRASQELAGQLLDDESLGVIYPSARRSGGTCIACFRPALVTHLRKRDLHRLSWYPDRPPSFVRIPRLSL